jgi:hypothetical protein
MGEPALGFQGISHFGTNMAEHAAAARLDHVEHALETVGAAVLGVGHVVEA